jgi:hypothetical protein
MNCRSAHARCYAERVRRDCGCDVRRAPAADRQGQEIPLPSIAGRLCRIPARRDREVVADHSRRQHQGGIATAATLAMERYERRALFRRRIALQAYRHGTGAYGIDPHHTRRSTECRCLVAEAGDRRAYGPDASHREPTRSLAFAPTPRNSRAVLIRRCLGKERFSFLVEKLIQHSEMEPRPRFGCCSLH